MNMIITTQSNNPFPLDSDEVSWIPCIRALYVDQYRCFLPSFDYIICTSQISWDEWAQNNREKYPTILTVGQSDANYFPEHCKLVKHKSAEDIEIDANKNYIWLRGDTYKRDFSTYSNVRSILTYKSEFDPTAIDEVRLFEPSQLYVYSQKVLTAFEEQGSLPETKLYHTKSCNPNKDCWYSTEEFYPGLEKYRN